MDAARGTLLAYATAPGSVAADGLGKNGLYTEELLQALQVPGLKIEDVFKRVRVNVTRRSNGAQTPWESSSLTGDLVVNGTAAVVPAAAPAASPAVDRDALFWSSIKDGTDPAGFRSYLEQFPNGTFAGLARQRLAGQAQTARAVDASRFDGSWHVTIDCPPHRNAAGYSIQLLAEVKDGVLAGQYGDAGRPNSLTLSGKIQPDGKAALDARGVTGDPKFAINQVSQGSPYSYRVDAQFDGGRGAAQRTQLRPCTLTFVK